MISYFPKSRIGPDLGLGSGEIIKEVSTEKQDLGEVPDLKRTILNLLLQIPEGMITTYKDIALALGDSAASRAVGTVMASNAEPEKYPCWKVVHSSGEVGKYSGEGGVEGKKRRMESEGIKVKAERVKNFSEVRFREFDIDPPLPRLKEVQGRVRSLVNQGPLELQPSKAAGVDVSYGPDGVVAAYVELEKGVEEPVREETIRQDSVRFPYIPGYLAFRELPILKKLLEIIREDSLAEVIFVDGNGILHPRKAGLASHLGVALDHPTIGVAKKLLCGEVDDSNLNFGEKASVVKEGEEIGISLKTYKRANPVYVSIGNSISLDQAWKLVLNFSKYKLPEPLRLAHKLAKKKAT